MADTPNYNLPYPDDYTQLADVPAAVKALAEATDDALGNIDLSDYYTKAEIDAMIGDIGELLDEINRGGDLVWVQ